MWPQCGYLYFARIPTDLDCHPIGVLDRVSLCAEVEGTDHRNFRSETTPNIGEMISALVASENQE